MLTVMPIGRHVPILAVRSQVSMSSWGQHLCRGKLRSKPPFHAQQPKPIIVVWLPSFASSVGFLSSFRILVSNVHFLCLSTVTTKLFYTLRLIRYSIKCTKHIEIDCHLIRDAYKNGFVALSHVRSSAQLTDIFMKVLSLPVFSSLNSKLGLVSLAPNPTCGGGDVDDKKNHEEILLNPN
ncbi:UNVERIFIED_CONTAM: hypothetical protein Sradi_3203500 [Sesamum radiatum]|uniref:Uncharacterized protein n=1 Tax=Sesamum radiatum TaxID=300843 RepID=A0AAW2RFK6_SESRA